MPIDEKKVEQDQINSLLERGVKFEAGGRSWTFREPYLGTLDRLSDQFLKMDIDLQALAEDPLAESKRMVSKNARRCANAIAIAVLNNPFTIPLFSGILSVFFRWTIKPSKLAKLTLLMHTMSNYGDFTTSTRLMSASRTTAPDLVEMADKGASDQPGDTGGR